MSRRRSKPSLEEQQLYWEEDTKDYQPTGEPIPVRPRILRGTRSIGKPRQSITAELLVKVGEALERHSRNPQRKYSQLRAIGEELNLGLRTISTLWAEWKRDPTFTHRQQRQETATFGRRFDMISRRRLERISRVLQENPKLKIQEVARQVGSCEELKAGIGGSSLNPDIVRRLLNHSGWRRIPAETPCPKYEGGTHEFAERQGHCRLLQRLANGGVQVLWVHHMRVDRVSHRRYIYVHPRFPFQPTAPALDCLFLLDHTQQLSWACSLQPCSSQSLLERLLRLVGPSQGGQWRVVVHQLGRLLDLEMEIQLTEAQVRLVAIPPKCEAFSPVALWGRQLMRRKRGDFGSWEELLRGWKGLLAGERKVGMQGWVEQAEDNRLHCLRVGEPKEKKKAVKMQEVSQGGSQ